MIFEHPTLAELALELPDAVALHGGMCAAADAPPLFEVRHAPDDGGAPFPLIGITRAYLWVCTSTASTLRFTLSGSGRGVATSAVCRRH